MALLLSYYLENGTRIVMEKDSQDKTGQELRQLIKEFRADLGRKSLEADLHRIIVEQASEGHKVDLTSIMH